MRIFNLELIARIRAELLKDAERNSADVPQKGTKRSVTITAGKKFEKFSIFSLCVWHACHTIRFMKMTMHINEDVLADVVKITGVESKTKAVEFALAEMVRRHRLKEFAKKGLGLTAEELRNAWEDPFPQESLKAAEAPPKYARKSARR